MGVTFKGCLETILQNHRMVKVRTNSNALCKHKNKLLMFERSVFLFEGLKKKIPNTISFFLKSAFFST